MVGLLLRWISSIFNPVLVKNEWLSVALIFAPLDKIYSTILFCNNWIWLGHGAILSHIMIYPREKQNKKTKVYCGNEWTVVIKKVEGKRIVC